MGSSRQKSLLVDRARSDTETRYCAFLLVSVRITLKCSSEPTRKCYGRLARLQPAVASKLMDLRQNRASCRFVVYLRIRPFKVCLSSHISDTSRRQ